MQPEQALRKYWNFTAFRGSQREIISAVTEGRDVLALLPTGGGKSLCYQIPSLVQEGICIVVSPLIALIQDQVESLKKRGVKAVALTGGISFEEMGQLLDNCIYGNYKFLYLSPERLMQEMVRERIARMAVNLIAIDEAHCISQWGHDFRPAYLHCAAIREIKPDVPLIALTATATRQVAADITANLELRNPQVFRDSFSRINIAFRVHRDEDKDYRLRALLGGTEESSIVYVRTRRLTGQLAGMLEHNGISATSFHGGLSKKEKNEKLLRWLNNEVRVMVATNAFGMGVDKPDVRLVIHYQIPDSVENYYQEAGRAGRDGLPASAVLITNKADENQLPKQFLSTLPDIPFLKKLYRKLNNYFQISYGTGDNQTFNFGFNAFCETYSLHPLLAYNGLLILDQYAVIALSQAFRRRTTVQFLTAKNQLMSYMERHLSRADLIRVILRTYGGIFDFKTPVNTLLIAKKSGIEEDGVIKVLQQLQADQIISYEGQDGDLDITFLVPREDELTIHAFARDFDAHRKVKTGNLEKMMAYVQNDRDCRDKQLLAYFGEVRKVGCGKCDVCLGSSPLQETTLRSAEEKILHALESGQLSSRKLIRQLAMEEAVVLRGLQSLLDSGNIYINNRNEYCVS